MRHDVETTSEPALEISPAARSSRCEDVEAAASLRRLAVNEITTYRWSLSDDVFGYRDAGISGLGVWRPKLADFGEERGVDLLLDSQLRVSSLSYVGGFTGSCGQSFEESLADAREMIDLAAAMKAECLVVVSGARALHTARHARRVFVDALQSLGDLAGERDLSLAVLPMHSMFSRQWTFLTTIDDTLRTLDQCDHPRIQMVFDAYHLWQEPKLIERIPQIAPRTALVRLSDWRDPPRSVYDRCLPGDGCIPLSQILASFSASGYAGSYEIEIWSEELWASDYVELLDECRERFASLYSGQSAGAPSQAMTR